MPPRDDPNNPVLEPFVRYKQHVDSTFASAFDNMFGPSGFHPRRADSTDWHNTPQPLSSQIRSLFWSTYNPTQLRDLPQPVPSDLPQGAEPILTFEDAFEDLLAVSQGQPLPDIQQKLSQRRLLSQVFPKGEPPTFWMRRLDAQGLIPRMHRDGDERIETRKGKAQPPTSKPEGWERLHSELARRREEAWNSEARDAPRAENMLGLDDLLKQGSEMLKSTPELEKHMKEIMKSIFNDITGRGQDPRRDGSPSHGSDAQQPEDGDKHPKTFDELFEHVQSFQVGGSSPWEAFTKSLDSGREIISSRDPMKQPYEGKTQQESSTEYYSTSRYVDKDGKTSVKTTWTKLDGQGNVIDRSEDSQVYGPSQKSSSDTTHEDQAEHHRGYPADNGEVKKPGWFWK